MNPNRKIELSYGGVDAKGKSYNGKTDSLTMNLKPETKVRVQQSGFRMLTRLDLPPGRYQLHVASHEIGGQVGSVLYDLEIPDYSKLPFSISALLITSMSPRPMLTAPPHAHTRPITPP